MIMRGINDDEICDFVELTKYKVGMLVTMVHIMCLVENRCALHRVHAV